MPKTYLKKLAKGNKAKEAKLEKVFKGAAEGAKKSGADNPYAVATSVVKKVARKKKK